MTEKSNKILIFTTAFRPFIGGSEIAIEEICRRLSDISFEILTPRYRQSSSPNEYCQNLCIHRLGFGNLLDKLLFPILGLFESLRMLQKYDIRVIHAYQASYGAGAAVLLKILKPKLKFVLTLQEGKQLEQQNYLIRTLRKFIIRKADTVTVISDYLKNYAQKVSHETEIFLIPNGADFEKFSKAEPIGRQALGLSDNDKIVITISRLTPKNGLSGLIKATALAKTEIPGLKLVIIGSGPLETELKYLANNLKIKNDILFLGAKEYEDIPSFLKSAGIFVRPSLSEGFGTAFIEAMAAGLPVIGSRAGGIPDFLKDGKTGLFCEADTPRDIADKIIFLFNNRELREKLIQNGLALAKEKYDWSGIAEKFRKIYAR